MRNIYEAVASNKRKSTLVIVFFIAFVTLAIYFISFAFSLYLGYKPSAFGVFGLALIISGFLCFFSYYYSDRIVLAISGAKQAKRNDFFNFYTVCENLALAAGLPKPKIYVIEDSAPNAFATGRDPDHAVICATTGLLDKLNRTELEGVIGHELSHIKNYDVRLQSIVAVLVGTVALLGDWFLRIRWHSSRDSDRRGNIGMIMLLLGLLFAILAPLIANLIKLAISRRREFLADAGSVAITHQPRGLISALKKIAGDLEPLEAANKATAHLYIVNPFKGKDSRAVSRFASLFNTHPPLEERIKQLETML